MPIGKLGRIRPAITPYSDKRFLNLDSYFNSSLRPPPSKVDWSHEPSTFGMMLNDSIGDCAIATICHQIQLWSLYTLPQAIMVPDPMVQQIYSAVSGYDPTKKNPITGENPTDTGCIMGDVFKWWEANKILGTSPATAVAIQANRIDHLKWTTDIFGSSPIGVTLPESAMEQTDRGKPWDVTPIQSQIAGGHAIPVVAYDDSHQMATVITWGQRQLVTYRFLVKYCDEAWAVPSPLWIDAKTGFSPVGLNLMAMVRDAGML
jgi:hypothetical protein